MKATRKLIPALVMLLISAVMLSTASFAWFSMNENVDVTGMQVSAKTDNTYLLIADAVSGTSDADKAASIQTGNKIEVDFAMEETALYPCAPADATSKSYLTTDKYNVDGTKITTAGVEVNSETTANAVTNWYTANALASDAATIDPASAKQLVEFDGYVVKKTVYLTVAEGANAANNLAVAATFAQKGAGNDVGAARVLITTSDGGFAILSSATTTADIKGNNTALTDETVLTVNIYIYYDGNDTAVNTNNAEQLTGATVELAFNVNSVPAA